MFPEFTLLLTKLYALHVQLEECGRKTDEYHDRR